MTYYLATVGEDGEIDVSFHATAPAARNTLMRDLYESYQDYDLPEEDTDKAISEFLTENDLYYTYRIGMVEVS